MSSPRDVVIVDGVRTPFVKSGTDLRDTHAADLGQTALTELLARTQMDPDLIDEVIVGNTGSPVDAVNIARVVALRSGVGQKTSCYTVHRNCASALESISSAYEKIKSGTMDVIVAGGTESMSQMPLLMSRNQVKAITELAGAAKKGPAAQLTALSHLLKTNFKQVVDMVTTPPLKNTPDKPVIAVAEGLTDPFVGINMGQTAELLAKEFSLSRDDQDAFAVESHRRAVEAQKSGRLAEEITAVFVSPGYKKVIEQDIGPRDGLSMQQLAKLKPFFDRKYGSITVGNACPLTDGAAMMLLMSRERAQDLGYKPMGQIKGYAFAGLEPERMGLGPVFATPIALKRAGGLRLKDMDLIELNEAFAAQVLACGKAFASRQFAESRLGLSEAVGEIDYSKVNVNGGAIALGHPVGATGTRLVLTLVKEMQRQKKQFGLATLCIGGGQGGAMVLELEP